MVAEQGHRQRWLGTAIIFAAWTVYGLLLASQLYMQAELRGQPVRWLARRVPIERNGLRRGIGVHVITAHRPVARAHIGGGIGRLPDEATRMRMAELVDSWPQGSAGPA